MVLEFGKETLTKEFKSDLKRLPDNELVEAVVALANTDGGSVYLGVEDDGTPTGLHEAHQDIVGMSSMIANKTVPPVSVRVDLIGDAVSVARIEVPRSRSVVSTKNGKILRRMMKADGTPESAPMYPYEIVTRLSDLGQLDYSDQPVFGSTLSDFDPQELKRLRRIIDTYQSSDRNLLELSDEDLEKSLRLTEEQTAAYSVEIWKRFRKWGGIPTGITQNIKDLLSSREIENIFENSDFIYMLNQASGDRQILAKQLNISPTQLSYVTNSNEGEGLLFYGNVIIPFVDRFPKNSLYKIMTTRLEETSEAG